MYWGTSGTTQTASGVSRRTDYRRNLLRSAQPKRNALRQTALGESLPKRAAYSSMPTQDTPSLRTSCAKSRASQRGNFDEAFRREIKIGRDLGL